MGKKRRINRAKKARAREMVRLVRNGEGVYVADLANDGPPPERAAQQGGIAVVNRTITTGGIVLGTGAVALGESAIGWLFRRGDLAAKDSRGQVIEAATAQRRAAAAWFLSTWRDAGLAQRVTASYQPATSKGVGEMSNKAARAMSALLALWRPERLGPHRAELLERVICFDCMPTPAEIPIIRAALDQLRNFVRA